MVGGIWVFTACKLGKFQQIGTFLLKHPDNNSIAGVMLLALEAPLPYITGIPCVKQCLPHYGLRALVHVIASIPCYAVPIGILAGILFFILSLLYFVSWLRFESGDVQDAESEGYHFLPNPDNMLM